jgi:hypothetical protein
MKSVMQEASSLIKAIEQGWIKAGQPQEFSIKILEEPQKNFIGMTIRSAKIALFFDEVSVAKAHENVPKQKHSGQQPREKAKSPAPIARNARESNVRESREGTLGTKNIPQVQPAKNKPQKSQSTELSPAKPGQQRQFQILWTEQMVMEAQGWLDEVLKTLNLGHITFTIEPQNFHLRITLSGQLLPDRDKEKQLLASFATLLLETLKHTFKTGLKGHKIVLTHLNF